MSGTLFVVATPIGNLKDITLRAIEVLQDVDFIAAEDTRHSAKLLQHLNITTPMVAIHEHNERQKKEWLVEKLAAGENIALISDAGTPLISDPGYPLVNYCRNHKINVVPIPGPSAVITALSAAGLPTDAFQFNGFLPVKAVAKSHALQQIAQSNVTNVYYESPRRILDTLSVCESVLGRDRYLVIAKELTKSFEAFVSGTASEITHWFKEDETRLKGEFVLLVSPFEKTNDAVSQEAETLLRTLIEHLPLKKAAAVVAEHYQLKKNDLYTLGLSWKD